jgi:RNA polymerase sigma-70 factor (ECF subfamily)
VKETAVPFQERSKNFTVHCPRREAKLYCRHQDGGILELFTFDKEYVERLRDGDPPTEQHFVSYFNQLLRIKLRARMLSAEVVDDLRQETFIRVIAAVRTSGGVRQPERFGAFVNSICNNVLLEFYRSSSRSRPLESAHLEIPDKVLDLEGMLANKQSRERIRQILEELPGRDRDLLRAFFLEEKDKDEVCRQFGVDRDYLRVLLHRAKDRFKSLYEKELNILPGRATSRRAV